MRRGNVDSYRGEKTQATINGMAENKKKKHAILVAFDEYYVSSRKTYKHGRKTTTTTLEGAVHVKKKKTSSSRGVRQLFYPCPIINLSVHYIHTHKKKRSLVHKLNVVRLPPSLFFFFITPTSRRIMSLATPRPSKRPHSPVAAPAQSTELGFPVWTRATSLHGWCQRWR